jgi:hypothetical protein
MRLLRETSYPLEKLILGLTGSHMRFVFAPYQKHLVVEHKGLKPRLILEDEGFVHDCLSDLRLTTGWWRVGVGHSIQEAGLARPTMPLQSWFPAKD